MASPNIRMHPRHEKRNRAKAVFPRRIIAELSLYVPQSVSEWFVIHRKNVLPAAVVVVFSGVVVSWVVVVFSGVVVVFSGVVVRGTVVVVVTSVVDVVAALPVTTQHKHSISDGAPLWFAHV